MFIFADLCLYVLVFVCACVCVCALCVLYVYALCVQELARMSKQVGELTIAAEYVKQVETLRKVTYNATRHNNIRHGEKQQAQRQQRLQSSTISVNSHTISCTRQDCYKR